MVDQTCYIYFPSVTVQLARDLIPIVCLDRADTECGMMIFTINCVYVDDHYRSMIVSSIVAIQDRVQKYTLLQFLAYSGLIQARPKSFVTHEHWGKGIQRGGQVRRCWLCAQAWRSNEKEAQHFNTHSIHVLFLLCHGRLYGVMLLMALSHNHTDILRVTDCTHRSLGCTQLKKQRPSLSGRRTPHLEPLESLFGLKKCCCW